MRSTRAYVDGLAAFLQGDTDAVIAEMRREMFVAADVQEYEVAARFRDRIMDVERALARQEVVTNRSEDLDLVALEDDPLEASLQVIKVRRGRVVGNLSTVLDRVEDVTRPELFGSVLRELYGEESPPRTVLVEELPPDNDLWEAWLAERRGGPVALRVPQRGAKRRLMETTRANAVEAFARHRMRRQSDHNARAQALRSLQDVLDLPDAPLRIEAYDIATLQGGDTRRLDGGARGRSARSAPTTAVSGSEPWKGRTTSPRWRRCSAAGCSPTCARSTSRATRRGRFSYPPSLILVDGGAGQLSRAEKVLDELGLDIPGSGAGQADGGGVPAGPARAAAHSPRSGGPLPPAEGARRGPPLRQHLSPDAPLQVDGRLGTRRSSRARPGPQEGASQEVRFAQAAPFRRDCRVGRGRPGWGGPVALRCPPWLTS